MGDDEQEARDELIEKLVDAVPERDLRLEVEFDDQDVSVGDSTVRLNGKTVIEGDQ
jgi:hypothetical protein